MIASYSIKRFYNSSDITFVVNGRKIPAYCCVLAAHCKVMSAVFSGWFAESNTAEVRSCDAVHDAYKTHNR